MKSLKIKFNALVFAFFILIGNSANAQSMQSEKCEIRPLKIGELVPDMDLGNIYNEDKIPDGENVKISAYKGKLLLLDFWSTNCGDCIATFPKLENLQKQFGNSIKILPIGFSFPYDHSNIVKTLHRWKGTSREMKIPTTSVDYEDSVEVKIRKTFPFTGMPTIVWIDGNGRFIGITDQYAVNEKNIQDVLNGVKVPFRLKRPWVRYEANEAINESFLISKSSGVRVKSASVLAKYIDTLRSLNGLEEFKTDSNYYRLVGVNKTIFELLISAYSELSEANRQLLNVAGGTKMILIESKRQFKNQYEVTYADNWERYKFQDEHLFNYELKISKNDIPRNDLFSYAIKDLERLFNIKTSISMRKIKCLAIKLKPNGLTTLTRTLKEKPSNLPGIDNKGITYFEKKTLDQMTQILNVSTPFRNLIINETNYKGDLGFLYPINMLHNISSVRSFLNSYGLDLVEVEREMEVLVIKDPND